MNLSKAAITVLVDNTANSNSLVAEHGLAFWLEPPGTAEVFRQYDVNRIGPAHCSGSEAAAEFKKAFVDRYFVCHAGQKINFQ